MDSPEIRSFAHRYMKRYPDDKLFTFKDVEDIVFNILKHFKRMREKY